MQPFDYYLFFDVEATCIEGGGFTYANEIIEFPVILVNGKTFEIVSIFYMFDLFFINTIYRLMSLDPTLNQQLIQYCLSFVQI